MHLIPLWGLVTFTWKGNYLGMLKKSILDRSLNITNTRLHLHLTEANGLNAYCLWPTVINTNYSRSDVNRNIKTSKQMLCKHLEALRKLSTFCKRYLFAMLNYQKKIIIIRIIFSWKIVILVDISLKFCSFFGLFSPMLLPGPQWFNRPVALIPQCTSPILSTHRFVADMCTCVHISVTKWCIVGYLSNALWDLWDWSIHWTLKRPICLWTRASLVQLIDCDVVWV